MKYTIEGLRQDVLVSLGCDGHDAIILRYIIDFYNTGKMRHKIINFRTFFWVHYGTIIKDLPVLKITTVRSLSDRFNKYVACGLMIRDFTKGLDVNLYRGREEKRKGTFSYFSFDPDMLALLLGSGDRIPDPYVNT